ncbi:MAG: hypothetical protein HOJ22_06090 [Chloroflexi bacterium]|jgi:hypothetical protein|nr:hypothetical protein [Chloroflexota bacterium]MBT5627843.1 hypothetical protein [Chloroflexota bacterium]
MTQDITISHDSDSEEMVTEPKPRFGRAFLTVISTLMFGMLIGAIFMATSYEKGDGLSVYERQAIEVVTMQNGITDGWNEMVDTFNVASVTSENEHVILYTTSQQAARALISDSQAVINRWRAIDVPEEHAVSHGIGLDALQTTQDGLILFDVFFQDAIDTLVADQIRSDEASDKLVHAQELWLQAAEAAANEG